MRREDAPSSEVFGTEEALAKIAMEMLKPDGQKLFTVSDVTPREIFGICYMLRYAEIFNSSIMKNWVKDFLLLRISRLRMGRREFLMMGTGMKEMVEEKRKKLKLSDLYSGLR